VEGSRIADDAPDNPKLEALIRMEVACQLALESLPELPPETNKQARTTGKPELQAGITNHTMRRTFALLLYESGASPAYVMAQMGHESAAPRARGVQQGHGA
jgi:hypothetical protein